MRYAIAKLALSIPTLLLVSILIFFLMRMIPGDPAVLLVGDVENVQAIEEARQRLGLDQPLPVQYWRWISLVVQGDLGVSLMTGEDVLHGMAVRFAVTAQVVLLAVAAAAAISIPLGTLAAWRQNRGTDFAIVAFANFLVSIPSFWAALMLIFLFGATLGWLPTVGYVAMADDLSQGMLYLILPVVALLFTEVSNLVRMVRSSTLEVLRQDFVTNALAKGMPARRVLRDHVVRNALAPTVTLLGLIIGSLLGGVTVIETVFTLPGLGRFLVDAIYARDYAVVQGVLLFVAIIYILVNLAVDLAYPLIDPKVRF